MKYLGRYYYYQIQFEGSVQLDRPLLAEQAAYLKYFFSTRRVSWRFESIQEIADPLREATGLPPGPEGAYFTGLSFDTLQGVDRQSLVPNQNKPPQGQPQLSCDWRLDDDGITLKYVGQHYLRYCSTWLQYLIEHFFTPWGYTLNGMIDWQGDEEADRGTMKVKDSQIEQQLFQAAGEKKLVWPDQPIGCAHQDALATQLVCVHFANLGELACWNRWFTGHGREFYPVCQSCAKEVRRSGTAPVLSQICWRCYSEEITRGFVGEMVGQPEVLVRSTSLSINCQRSNVSLAGRLLDIQPVDDRQESVWIALTHEGKLSEINLTTGVLTPLLTLPDSRLHYDKQVTLHVAPGGRYVAIVNTLGQYGIVLDLETGQVTMQLERDDYCIEHSSFPLAFFADEGRLLMIHGTCWNRLDISDPQTGEALTERVFAEVPGKRIHEHYLNYFHCSLSVSPDQQWVVDNGWIWQPTGSVRVWDIQRWLHKNLWESEDGPSQLGLCDRTNYWDGPLCWIDERVVAVWGYGDIDEEELIPAVRLFDVVAEKELDWIAGPEGTLFYDEYLFALSEKHGLTAWDIATGERVLADPNFHPTRYHRGAKHFLQIEQQGNILIGVLVAR